MLQTVLASAFALSAAGLWLIDSAVKGAVLLLIAGCVALLLRRDSAATRHLVWLVAVITILIAPALSIMLPQWRVLPSWTRSFDTNYSRPLTTSANSIGRDLPIATTEDYPEPARKPTVQPIIDESLINSTEASLPQLDLPGDSARHLKPDQSGVIKWLSTNSLNDWLAVVPWCWAVGCFFLLLRLAGARILLSRIHAESVAIEGGSKLESDAALTELLKNACLQLGVRKPITLLVHPHKTVPVVWGIFRRRLLIPETARQWSDEQLRSVLLHELSHIKRRDALSQLITQTACALHWFNPLVWFAAWRLHVERERACDDLVLTSGVRASVYAEHLLDVATRLTSSQWTQAVGLAMARSSSLQGRLSAVLNSSQNRRGTTFALIGLSVVVSIAIAVPIAMLSTADEAHATQAGNDNASVKQQLNTAAYRGLDVSLLQRWQQLEASETPIPETRVATLRSAIGRFIEGIDASQYSLSPEQVVALRKLQKQDAEKVKHSSAAVRDWISSVFAIHGEPIQMAFNEAPWVGTPGNAAELSRLAFGPADASGLRVAFVCEKESFIFGDSARLDLQLWNTGKETLIVGIGRDGNGLYPALDLQAMDREGQKIAVRIGAEPEMLNDVKFAKSWQLRPGETADVYGYRIRIGTGTPRESENYYPAWYTLIEIPEVKHGTEIVLTGTLPGLTASAKSSDKLQTGKTVIKAIAPESVEVWSARGPGKWPMPDGVTLELKRNLFHGADVATDVVLTWPPDATGTTYAFTSYVASDAFGNREPWHVVWERDSKTFWTMRGNLGDHGPGLAKPMIVSRIDFADQSKIVTTSWSHQPEAMPEGVRIAFEKVFQPLPATPRQASEADGSIYVHVEPAHDVRPIEELLRGVWKGESADVDVQLSFPERDSEDIGLSVNYGNGTPVVAAKVGKIRNPAQNSIRLWLRPFHITNVDEDDVIGILRRGPNSSLLLEITGSPKFPEYAKVASIVLKQQAAPESNAVIAPPQNPGAASESSDQVKLPAGLEKHLDWSEPVNGLRAAVMIRSTESAGILGRERKIDLVIQNVTNQAIRFCDTAIHETDTPAADVEGRVFYLAQNGETLFALQNAKSTKTDMSLQPGELWTFDMFDNEKANNQDRKTGDVLAEGIVKVPSQSVFVVLKITHAPDGAWTGKLRTPATRGAFASEGSMPDSEEGIKLFKYLVDHARLNGDIPGGLINRLHDLVKEFIRNNAGDQYGDPYATKIQPLLTRFENQGDWKQADVVKLINDIAAVTTIPIERTMNLISEHTLQRGQPLEPGQQDANWGTPLVGGLRMAWVLEPREESYHLGSSLKSRVLLHNSGNEPVIFVTRSFHQPMHTAVRAKGGAIQVDSTYWTTLGRPEAYRLHPGESCEVHAPGIGVGARDDSIEDWANTRVGSWILADEGDQIVFQPGPVVLSGDHNQAVDPDWWLTFITERINRDAPLPTDAKEREVILFRIVSDLFGNSPTPEEADAFYSDKSADAISNFARMLSKRSWHKSVSGSIKSGNLEFGVLPKDPTVATRPRVTANPGRFNLSDEVRLIVTRRPVGNRIVTRRPVGNRIVNEAHIVWFPPGKENVMTPVPLPDGYGSWSAGFAPGTMVLWISQKDRLSSYDFTDNAAIKVAIYEGDQIASAGIALELREALRAERER